MLFISEFLFVQVRGAKTLIIWTDCDREGENIGMEVTS
jgi:DNA topoisomerase-3